MNVESGMVNFWWPDVSTKDQARAAAKGGVAAASLVAVITSAFAVYAIFRDPLAGITPWSFVDAFLFGIIALVIWRMSRVAAVSGLLLYLIEQAVLWSTTGPHTPFMALLFILFFVHAVRATVSYHRLNR